LILATLDTGALVAIERRKQRGMMLLRAAREHRARLVTITPVVAEWWRGRSMERDRMRQAIDLVPLPLPAAEAAGIALGSLPSGHRASLAIDVMVMAFAALYGGAVVYTSDVDDLQRIGALFPSVRVLAI
jgi:predicted nucleic acid-binding protein